MNESFNKPSYGTKYSVTCFFFLFFFFSSLFIYILLILSKDSTPVYFMGGLLERTSCKSTPQVFILHLRCPG